MTIHPLLRSSSPFIFSRSISLNSAINRGLRRSPGGRLRPGRRPPPPPPSSPPLDSPSVQMLDKTPTHYSPRLGSSSEPSHSSTESNYSPYTPRDSPLIPRPYEPDSPDSPLISHPYEPDSPVTSYTDTDTDTDRYNPNHSPTRYTTDSRDSDTPFTSNYYAWHPLARPNPRLDYASPSPSADWVPRPRRHIPKTNLNSEWIYGTSTVEAALKMRRRTFYKLHILVSENRSPENRARDKLMRRIASDAKVKVVEEKDGGLLDSMCNSRPHNGYVLECLPLPRTPILSLGRVARSKTSFTVQLAQHHHTTGKLINEGEFSSTIACRDPRRFPFVLMLDEILDPGNLGAIIRSAYYLGVDAIALSSRNCAPLSPVCLKASAGAAELLPILEQSRSDKLISGSCDSGWMFYAGIPPPTRNQSRRDRYVLASQVSDALTASPVVLILGGEGDGVRPFLRKHVDRCVSLDKGPGTDTLVDSLNVGVAAALLCSSFLKKV